MRIYRSILSFICGLVVVSCSFEEQLEPISNSDVVEILGVPANFTRVNVGTKGAEDSENDIREVTMAIFNTAGKLAGSVVNLSGNASFTIDKTNGQIVLPDGQLIGLGTGDLSKCTIYIIANSWTKLNEVVTNKGANLTTDDIEAVQMDVTGIGIPSAGFPMIGKEVNVNLSSSGASNMLPIRLNKLYAKINVIFQVSATQVVETPSFHMDTWSVHNIPTMVTLGEPNGQTYGAEDPSKVEDTQPITSPTVGMSTILNSDPEDPETFTLTFYLPEHVVNPQYTSERGADKPTYPDFPPNLPESEYQRYKPKMFGEGKYPTYVQVKGSYTDHRGEVSSVIYDLYLGQDNTDDFRILRNQELNNKIVIKGITDSKEATDNNVGGVDNVSVDHRVSITSTGYSIAIERESLLDSHFEYRPVDITVQKGAKVSIEVQDPSKCNWLRFDVTDQIRDYFTTNLVTETLKNNTFYELDNTSGTSEKSQRIWVYIDENDNYYDDLLDKNTTDTEEMKHIVPYREHDLVIKYYKNSTDQDPETHYYTFRQNNLWRVWGGIGTGDNANKNRFYDIENHEEYLYNYASDDTWDTITDGMAWGMPNVQLSENDEAVYLTGTLWNGAVDYLIENAGLKVLYDFYLPRDITNDQKGHLVTHEFAGLSFSNQLAYRSGSHDNITNLKLSGTPTSAIEYCYHKNKRTQDGKIPITRTGTEQTNFWGQVTGYTAPWSYSSTAVKWFLPSIDQIEEIVKDGFGQFDEFQDNLYWSSQPAYTIWQLYYNGLSSASGVFFTENTNYARATKVDVGETGNWVDPSFSGETTPLQSYSYSLFGGGLTGPTNTGATSSGQGEGYKNRTSINRVRCVYRTGYGDKPITDDIQ